MNNGVNNVNGVMSMAACGQYHRPSAKIISNGGGANRNNVSVIISGNNNQ